jgi:hypothetical protein
MMQVQRTVRGAAVSAKIRCRVIPIPAQPHRLARFVASRHRRGSCDPSLRICLISHRVGRRGLPIAPLDKCWEQPLYPINGSGLLGDFSPGIVTYSQGQLPSWRQSYQDLTDGCREIPSFVSSTMRNRALSQVNASDKGGVSRAEGISQLPSRYDSEINSNLTRPGWPLNRAELITRT